MPATRTSIVNPRYTLSQLRALTDSLKDDIYHATTFNKSVRVNAYRRNLRTLPPDRLRFSSSLLRSYRSLRHAHALSSRPTTCPTTYDRRILEDMRRLALDILSR